MNTELRERPGGVPALFLIGVALVSLSAALLAAWCTSRYGIGVSPDSAYYIVAARSLAAGQGLRFNGEPLVHWPPGYPLLLAGLGVVGVEPLEGARAFAILLYAANVALVCWVAFLLSGRSAIAGIGAGVLLLVSPEMLHFHVMAWSEPPFLCLTFLSLLLFCRSLDRGGSLTAAAGLCAGAALLTRFVGFTLLPPFLLCIAVCRPEAGRRRVRETLLFLCPAILPMTAWQLYNRAVAHAASVRAFAFHPPGVSSAMLIAVAALAAAEIGRRFGRGRLRGPCGVETVLSLWLLAFLVTYCSLVYFSLCFLDALTPLDGRIMSPVLICGGLYCLGSIWSSQSGAGSAPGQIAAGAAQEPSQSAPAAEQSASRSARRPPESAPAAQPKQGSAEIASGPPRWWQWIATAALVLAAGRAATVLTVARQQHDAGYGYTSRAWRNSPTLAWIDSLPPGQVIYSNVPELIAFRNRRTAHLLPPRYNPTSRVPSARLADDIAALQAALRQGAVVVYFPSHAYPFLLSAADLERTWRIPVLLRLRDGVVYGSKSP